MSITDLRKALMPVNCRYNFEIADDGKCYSNECVMNIDPELKDRIKKEGCKCFNMPEVQELLNKDLSR